MTNSITSKSKTKTHWLVKAFGLAMIGVLSYTIEKMIDRNFEKKSTQTTQPSTTQNHVDSKAHNNVQSDRDVFLNQGRGQQNNNTGSGQQTITNK